MKRFLDYLDLRLPLSVRLGTVFEQLNIAPNHLEDIRVFLDPLRVKDRETYDHSIRVGLFSEKIARLMHLDSKIGLFAGLLHDVGKAQTRPEVLQKTDGWTKEDSDEIMLHVMDGYRLIRGRFDFSAEVILWHHRFQPNAYPENLPTPLHTYSRGTLVMIPFFGRLLSLADTFDALHRVNSKHGDMPLTGEVIKGKMFEYHKDQRVLIEELFAANVFTTDIFDREAVPA